MNGLNKKVVSNQLSVKLKADIDKHCETAYDSGNPWRLGASKIGEPCSRKLWYGFRWVKQEKFDGRMQRLLNRGNHEEVRFIEWLRGIGCQVWDKDEQGKQFKISGAKGHFGGALDSVIKLPLEYDFNEPLLGEFKTNCTGAGFNKLCSSGVTVSKPLHFAQACIYGYKYNLTHCAYLNLNKQKLKKLFFHKTHLKKFLKMQIIKLAQLVILKQFATIKKVLKKIVVLV